MIQFAVELDIEEILRAHRRREWREESATVVLV